MPAVAVVDEVDAGIGGRAEPGRHDIDRRLGGADLLVVGDVRSVGLDGEEVLDAGGREDDPFAGRVAEATV